MGSIWGIHQLAPHPAFPARGVERVTAQVLAFDSKSLLVEYTVSRTDTVILPPEAEPARTDGLWRTTCFEAFLKSPLSETYLELNFSPSFAWAAYSFDRYREGMQPLPLDMDPEISVSEPANHLILSAEFNVLPHVSAPTRLGLSAVIEERDGTKSYWALRHPPGDKPDFHHPDCFALELPPASGT